MDEKTAWMERAVAVAVQNVAEGGGPFGAVVVKDGLVIGEGANRVTALNDPTAHAEVLAIRAACQASGSFSLAGAVLYTTCEPCPMCLAACYWAHLDAIYCATFSQEAAAAGFDDAYIYTQLKLPLEQRTLPITPLQIADGSAPFQAWLAKLDKTPY